MAFYEFAGRRPLVHPSTFVHPLASIIGRVEIGPGCYVGAGACLRGDWLSIRVGSGSNVQDSCTVHGFPGAAVVLEEGAHLGHGCVVHGAHLFRNVLVGMNAVVQDGAELGEGSVVGAGCVVPAGMLVPAGKLVVGIPARVVGDVGEELREAKLGGTGWYQELAHRSLSAFTEVPAAECLSTDSSEAAWVPWAGGEETLGEYFL
jgi:phenylacetic acid degradation protein